MKAMIVTNKKYKRKKIRSPLNIFPVLVICLCIATSLMMASFFSTIITANGFGLITTSAKTQSATTVWAISVGICNTYAQAEELSESTKSKGGGGVIYKTDVFHVLASAYEIENDAIKVQGNLQNQGIVSQIVKLEVKQTSISANYTVSEVGALDACLNLYKDAFRTLFDLSISLDTQTKNETFVKDQLLKLVQRANSSKENFSKYLNKKLTANLVSLSLQNERTTALLKQVQETSKPLSVELKAAYLSIIISQAEMLASLQTTVF